MNQKQIKKLLQYYRKNPKAKILKQKSETEEESLKENPEADFQKK